MNQAELFYLIPYLLSLALSLGIFIYTWQHRFVRGARAYSWFVGGQTLTILGFILELISPNLEIKLLWDKFQWLTDTYLVILPFLIFSVQFSEFEPRRPRLTWGFWLGIPILFTLVLLTDDLHHLLYPNPHLNSAFPFSELQYDYTFVVYGFGLVYVYGANFYGIGLLIRRALQPYNAYRLQYWTVAAGFLIPIALSILSLFNIRVAPQRDISPFSFAIGNLVVAWGLFRYRLFDLIPIARERVLENMTAAVIVLDAANRVVDINQVALANIGKQSVQVIGHPVREVLAEWPGLIERIQNLEDAKLEISAKVQGELRTYDLSISPIRDKKDNLIGRVFVAHDITARKMLEERYRQLSEELEQRVHERTEELRKSTERYRAVVENQTEFIVRWKADGLRTFANEAYRRYFGLTPEQAVSSRFMPLVAEEDRSAVEEKLSRLLSGAVASETDIHRVIKPDGSIGWQEWVDQAILDETGQIVEFQSVGRDITERRRMEEALAASEAELRALFASMKEVVLVIDHKGVYRKIAPTNPELLYKASSELLGKTLHDVFPAEQAETFLGTIQQVVEMQQTAHIEYQLVINERNVWFDASISPMGLDSTLWMARDVTERKQAEAALRESNERFKRQFKGFPISTFIWKYDADDFVLADANDAAERSRPGQIADYLGKRAEEIYRDTPEISNEIRRCFEEQTTLRRAMQYTIPNTDESYYLDVTYVHLPPDLVMVHLENITERKRAEEALREKTEELERFFISALDLLCIADTDGYFLRLNREWEKVLGYRLEDLEGKRFLDLVHPDDQQATLAAIVKLEAQKEVLDFTNRYRCKDGTYRWIEWRSILHGKLIYAAARDITERKHAEDALRESEERFRSLSEAAFEGIMIHDNGIIQNANQAFASLFGYADPKELIGKNGLEILAFTPESRENIKSTIGKGLEGVLEIEVARPDGSIFPAETQGRDITIKGRKLRVVAMRDITERKRIELALQESEKRYRNLVEFSPVAMTVHVEGRIVYINPAGAKLWGCDKPEEVLGRSPLDFVHPDYRERVTERVQQIRTMEQSLPPLEVKNIRLDGQMLYTVGTGIPIIYEGKPAILSVVLDITERVRAEEKLRELTRRLVAAQEEERKRIAQELHDELGQAMTAISLDLGNIEKALPPEALPGIRERLIDTRSLADEVDERISELALDLRPSLLDDLGLLPTLRWYLNRYSQRLGIEVVTDFKGLESRLPEEVETTLYRVIQEALTNIARHAQANTVYIRLERGVSTVIAYIQDDGRGFDAEQAQHSAVPLSGMGLLGIKDRVSTLGGLAEIQASPGEGVHIQIEIPL